MGGPTSSLCYRQHSSRDHVTTQAPPLRQSSDTFGGIRKVLYEQYHTSALSIDGITRFGISILAACNGDI
jgi:hypothetical protein